MSKTRTRRGAEGLLQDAIEEVLRTVGRWLWLMLGLGVVASLLGYGLVLNKMFIVGYVTFTHSGETLYSALIFWSLVSVATVALGYFQHMAVQAITRYAARRLAVPAVLATSQRAGRPETLANEAIHNIEVMRTSLAGPVANAMVAVVMTPLLIVFVFILHWAYGLLAMFYCALAGVLSWMITKASVRAANLTGTATSRAYGLAADAMRSGEAVLAMGLLPRLVRHWISVSTETAGEAWMAERQAQRLRTMLEIAMGYFRGSILMMSALLMLTGQSVTAVLAGALFILGRLTDPFLQLGSNSEEVAQGLAAWRRLRGLVDGSGLPPDGLCFPCPEGRLVVERLSFTYKGPAPTLLRNIDLVVEPGEVVAIVGPSGSGKSTLLRLLIGMYKSGSGGVYLDGHSTGQWDRRDLARHLGFLPQEPTLSRGTAAEVISRLETPDMSLVLEASRRAGAHEAIIALPNGYATQISGNYQFSMGQRHRVALARAIYGRPRVLVLDELAGSLDAEGEAHVARLLGTLREEGTSVIFTTHRPGLLAVADRVLALRGGSLVPAQEEAIPRLPPRQARLTQSPLIKEAAA